MSLNSVQLITAKGQAKLAQALATGLAVQITEVALGDGNGGRYAPSEQQTGLKRQRARNPITKQHMADDRTWRVSVEFGSDIPSFTVREVGFFDDAGDLIFIVAGPEMSEGTTGAYELLYDAYLNLSSIKDGLVIVAAPDDEVFNLSVVSLQSFATIHLEQFRQSERIRDAFGSY